MNKVNLFRSTLGKPIGETSLVRIHDKAGYQSALGYRPNAELSDVDKIIVTKGNVETQYTIKQFRGLDFRGQTWICYDAVRVISCMIEMITRGDLVDSVLPASVICITEVVAKIGEDRHYTTDPDSRFDDKPIKELYRAFSDYKHDIVDYAYRLHRYAGVPTVSCAEITRRRHYLRSELVKLQDRLQTRTGSRQDVVKKTGLDCTTARGKYTTTGNAEVDAYVSDVQTLRRSMILQRVYDDLDATIFTDDTGCRSSSYVMPSACGTGRSKGYSKINLLSLSSYEHCGISAKNWIKCGNGRMMISYDLKAIEPTIVLKLLGRDDIISDTKAVGLYESIARNLGWYDHKIKGKMKLLDKRTYDRVKVLTVGIFYGLTAKGAYTENKIFFDGRDDCVDQKYISTARSMIAKIDRGGADEVGLARALADQATLHAKIPELRTVMRQIEDKLKDTGEDLICTTMLGRDFKSTGKTHAGRVIENIAQATVVDIVHYCIRKIHSTVESAITYDVYDDIRVEIDAKSCRLLDCVVASALRKLSTDLGFEIAYEKKVLS